MLTGINFMCCWFNKDNLKEQKVKSTKNVYLMLSFRFLNSVAYSVRSASVFDSYIHMQYKDNASVGKLTCSSGLAILFAASAAGFICDSFRKRRSTILRIFAFLSTFCMIINYIAIEWDSFPLLLISSFLWGSWHEFVYIITDSLYTDSVSQGNRSEFFMYRRLVATLASSTAPIITIIMFTYYGNAWHIDILHFVLQFGVILGIPQALTLLGWEDVELDDTIPKLHEDASYMNNVNILSNRNTQFWVKHLPLSYSSVPWIIFLSNVITFAGAGMTVKFFPLFLKNEYYFAPIHMCLLSSVYTISMAVVTYIAQRYSKCIGRAQVSFFFTLIGICGLFLLANVYSLEVLIVVYIIRGAFQNASAPLDKSMIMDFVSPKNRGKWVAMESVTSIIWSVSALFGGFIIDKNDYRFTFIITGYIYLLAQVVYIPCLWLVPKEEKFDLLNHPKNKIYDPVKHMD